MRYHGWDFFHAIIEGVERGILLDPPGSLIGPPRISMVRAKGEMNAPTNPIGI